ncbi:MAG: hypothetical protein WDO56_06875 [Gammaproteobacteria bacterium]
MQSFEPLLGLDDFRRAGARVGQQQIFNGLARIQMPVLALHLVAREIERRAHEERFRLANLAAFVQILLYAQEALVNQVFRLFARATTPAQELFELAEMIHQTIDHAAKMSYDPSRSPCPPRFALPV